MIRNYQEMANDDKQNERATVRTLLRNQNDIGFVQHLKTDQ